MGTNVPVLPLTRLDTSSAVDSVNENFRRLSDALDRVLLGSGYRLSNSLDANGRTILNLPDATSPNQPVTLRQLTNSGQPGPAGRGITNVIIDGSGHLIIFFTDGTSTDVGLVVGGGTTPVVSLNALAVSLTTATVGTPFVAYVSNSTNGSSLSITGAGSAGLSISGTTISGTPTAAGSVNIVETLPSAVNSPRTTSSVLTVIASGSFTPTIVTDGTPAVGETANGNDGTLPSGYSVSSRTWMFAGDPLEGATGQTLTFAQPGPYRYRVYASNGTDTIYATSDEIIVADSGTFQPVTLTRTSSAGTNPPTITQTFGSALIGVHSFVLEQSGDNFATIRSTETVPFDSDFALTSEDDGGYDWQTLGTQPVGPWYARIKTIITSSGAVVATSNVITDTMPAVANNNFQTDTAGLYTLSNNQRTATRTADGANGWLYAGKPISTGALRYFELTINNASGGYISLAIGNGDLTGDRGSGSNRLTFFNKDDGSDRAIFRDGSYLGSFGNSFVTGQTVGFEYLPDSNIGRLVFPDGSRSSDYTFDKNIDIYAQVQTTAANAAVTINLDGPFTLAPGNTAWNA